MKAATLDERRRLVMPPACPPNAAVTIQQLDANTWLVKRCLPEKKIKMVSVAIIDRLPDDPEWDKVETKIVESISRRLPPPEE